MDAYLSREGQGWRGAGWGQGGVYRPRHDAKGLAERRGAPAPPRPCRWPGRQPPSRPERPSRAAKSRSAAQLCFAMRPCPRRPLQQKRQARPGPARKATQLPPTPPPSWRRAARARILRRGSRTRWLRPDRAIHVHYRAPTGQHKPVAGHRAVRAAYTAAPRSIMSCLAGPHRAADACKECRGGMLANSCPHSPYPHPPAPRRHPAERAPKHSL